MNDSFRLNLVRSDGSVVPAEVRLSSEPGCHIVLQFETSKLEATGNDFFAAFSVVRRQLETKGILPHCYAASRNVYPSGMARDMGRGLVAYRLKLGEQRPPRVRIFETGEDVEPVSVDDQKNFFDEWRKSIGAAV